MHIHGDCRRFQNVLSINVFRILNVTNVEDLIAHRLSVAWASYFRKKLLPHQQAAPPLFPAVDVNLQGMNPVEVEIVKACQKFNPNNIGDGLRKEIIFEEVLKPIETSMDVMATTLNNMLIKGLIYQGRAGFLLTC